MQKTLSSLLIMSVLAGFCACKDTVENTDPQVMAEMEGEFSGGKEGTVFDKTANAFGNSLLNLDSDEIDRFIIGNSFNRNNWVIAPSSTAARDGLGPFLNAASCAGCHALDGKGNPFQSDGINISQALLFRLSIPGQGLHGEPKDDPNYGGQFNPRSIPNVNAEGEVEVSYQEVAGKYPDGASFSLRRPTYKFKNLNYGAMNGTMISPRIAPSMIGMGLLDAVSEQTILANIDVNDSNGDGISGRANYVWGEKIRKKALGNLVGKLINPPWNNKLPMLLMVILV